MISVESKICFKHEKPNKEPEADYITYGELAQKVGTMIFCNDMDERYRSFIDMKYKYANEISQGLCISFSWY